MLRATHGQPAYGSQCTVGVLPGPTGVTIHPVRIVDRHSADSCVRVVRLVVVVWLVRRAACTRQIVRNRRWDRVTPPSLHAAPAQAIGDLAFPLLAVPPARAGDDALSSIRLLLLHPWVCLLYGSCLTPARPHASDCSRFTVAVLPAARCHFNC